MLTIYDLNKDLIYEIQKYLSTKKLILLSRTCKQLRSMFKDNLSRLSLNLYPFTYKITDNDLEYLKGVHRINLQLSYKITDNGLKYLKGVHTIILSGCEQITDSSLVHLKGVHTICLFDCCLITDNGLEHL